MIRLNPDPETGGYAYMPLRSVTSRFPFGSDVQGALMALTRSGLHEEQIDIFTGVHGADELDTKGHLHGIWIRFFRTIQDALTDEAPLFKRADDTMRAGGSVVAVFTAGREDERQSATRILKAFGGVDTVYWGGLVTEYM